jgi:hypothetical protein
MRRDKFLVESALAHLDEVPCTETSLKRLIEGVRSASDATIRLHLVHALSCIPFDLLRTRWEEIAASPGVPDDAKQHLETRLDLASRPLEMLWDELMRHAADIDGKYYGEFDGRISERLIEALARHPAVFGPRAIELLRDESIIDWREHFCLELVGEMRHEPAVDVLLDKLRLEDDEGPHEAASDALVRIGTADIVLRTAKLFPKQGWDFRLFACKVFDDVKRPESEAAVLSLLPNEKDETIRAFLACALCDLCSREGLEIVRQIFLDGDHDESVAELDELILTVGQMVGYEPPEAPQWRKEIAEREAERERLQAEDPETWTKKLAELAAPDSPAPANSKRRFDVPDPVSAPVPEHRTEPRLGRNDPCPCGSGRKYKKCCLKERATP